MKKKQIKVIDLFAGVGGFRRGFIEANEELNKKVFKVVWGNQWEPGKKVQYAAEIYRREFKTKDDEFANVDIATVPTDAIPEFDLMCGGFPCQDYSVATTKKLSGGIEGKKGVLWWQIERILREIEEDKRPEFLFFENVDRLLSSPAKQRGRDFAIMLACLDALGYMIEWRVIDASEYGYPQRRKRTYFLGYKKGSSIYEKFQGNFEKWIMEEGVFAEGFPVEVKPGEKLENLNLRGNEIDLDYKDYIKFVSDTFNKGGKQTPFNKAGLVMNGRIGTIDVISSYNGEKTVLGNILIDEKDVPEEYYIPKSEYPKWEYLKGAKKEKRIQKSTGFEYNYSEGKITYPDDPNKPSRTIITGEGGRAPSRFKHVVKTPSGRLRRLTPIELEKLDMFPENHTDGYPPSIRAFLMGNALVVGVIQKIAKTLYEKM